MIGPCTDSAQKREIPYKIKYLLLKMEFLRKDEAFNGLYSLWSKQNIIDLKTFEDFVEISFLKH